MAAAPATPFAYILKPPMVDVYADLGFCKRPDEP
jgi:hypothetical protein